MMFITSMNKEKRVISAAKSSFVAPTFLQASSSLSPQADQCFT